jgi:hypothetical protein
MRRLAFVVIAVVGLGACSGGTATPAASAGSPPLGTYALKASNLPSDQVQERLTLLDGGQYKQSISGFAITGTWSAAQGQLTFTETAGGACPPNTPGTYTWAYAGTDLTLTLVKDDCIVRPADFSAAGPWVKQP